MRKLLYVLFLVIAVIVNEASADVQNKNQLRNLVEYRLVPDFKTGGLVLRGKSQFAVAILLPDTQWKDFTYKPCKDGDGKKPLIDSSSSLSPPGGKYGNYLAARPNYGEHSETQILDKLHNLYNQYKVIHDGKPPKALLLYSWIVPCVKCTDAIVAKLAREPFNSIPTKVIAYTTLGTKAKCKCDVEYTKKKLENTSIDLLRVYTSEEELIQKFFAQLLLE